jgi:hypothetical protein
MFLECYIPCSNCCWLKLHKPLIIILRDDPVEHLFFTLTISGLLISSKAVGKLLVESKTLGWGNTLGKDFKRVFENLGVVSTPLKCFLKDFVWDKWKMGSERKEVGGFLRKDIGDYVFTRGNLIRVATLPRYGTGLSSKSICLSAGSLTLYKGL